jgi:alpha-mannosidase
VKRRDFFKRMSVLGSGALALPGLSGGSLQNSKDKADTKLPRAQTIRGIVEKNGAQWQPIQVWFEHSGAEAEAVVRVDGVERARHSVTSGVQSLEALVPSVATNRKVELRLEIGDKRETLDLLLKPVRQVVVYVLPHSHTDIGYTEVQSAVELKQMENLRKGIALARKTSDYPPGARFVWNVEVLWTVDLYMKHKSSQEIAEFLEALKNGWVSLNGMFANELTGLCRPEELLQLFRYATRFSNEHGTTIDSAMISDVPGYTWGTVSAMAQAGIRYFSAAPNFFDRIGSIMQQWQDKPCWWVSPSGRERVLFWIPWTGYAFSHVKHRLTPEVIGDYHDRLDSVSYPYGISYMRWSGHGDNAEPDPDLPEDIKSWNAKYAWPRFVIASTSTAFSAFEKRYGHLLPEYRGDLTPYWEDGAGSSALETGMNRSAADRLIQAEALFAMNGNAKVPIADFQDAWRNVLLYSEHTWGAWCSVSDSENKLTKDQWEIKRAFAVDSDAQSRKLLIEALRNPDASTSAGKIEVFNTTSWPRTELVLISANASSDRDRVVNSAGQPIPSQRLKTGELAVWVESVPPFGSVLVSLGPGNAAAHRSPVKVTETQLDNGILQVRIDSNTGAIAELREAGTERNLVDTSSGEQLNEFLFLEGDELKNLQKNGRVKISVLENGPLVASLRIESAAPGCKSLVRVVRMSAGADFVVCTNIVDKLHAPLNPTPGKDNDFAQRKAKESLQFAFPFNVPQGTLRLDMPFMVIQPETNQLPGSCKNWLPVGRWVDISNDGDGVTWVTLDAPLLEIGEISARLLGSQTDPNVWRKQIEPTQKFYSWAMNNHWGTNYRAYQEGQVTFRYVLRPHGKYDAAEATRFSTGLSQPLVCENAREGQVRHPLLQVEPSDVLVTAFKVSDDGKAWILRLFGASGRDRTVQLKWASPPPKGVSTSDLSEKPGAEIGESLIVPAFSIVTLRAERA